VPPYRLIGYPALGRWKHPLLAPTCTRDKIRRELGGRSLQTLRRDGHQTVVEDQSIAPLRARKNCAPSYEATSANGRCSSAYELGHQPAAKPALGRKPAAGGGGWRR